MSDRSIQQTRHASQTQSSLMACLTDPIRTHDMLDRSNQPVFSILDLGLQWCFHCKFSYFCIEKKNPILVTYTHTHTYIHSCRFKTSEVCKISWDQSAFIFRIKQSNILLPYNLPPPPIPSNNMMLHPTFSNNAVRNSSTAHMKTADRISSDSERAFLLDKIEM